MIFYQGEGFGIADLFRIHGSSMYKTLLPALFSTGLLVVLDIFVPHMREVIPDERVIVHPFAVGAIISFISFLLTFQLNHSYGRYWDSATAIHQMQSKWTDCAITVAAFHYQQVNQYQEIRPPAFGDHPDVRSKDIIGNPRNFRSTWAETEDSIREVLMAPGEQQNDQEEIFGSKRNGWFGKLRKRKRTKERDTLKAREGEAKDFNSVASLASSREGVPEQKAIPIPLRFQDQFTLLSQKKSSTELELSKKSGDRHLEKAPKAKVPHPSLLLQELAHLVSLLSAVAMATLRVDNPLAEVPLTEYIPGRPMPPADPDDLEWEIKHEYGEDSDLWKWTYYLLGISRTEKRRTLYNAARPFGVLGGVSDNEVRLLYEAHGPYAKVALCSMWLQEFITREHLDGGLGPVHPPIVSRIYQYVSDGLLGYNQARKTSYTPFPYPHTQITTFFTVVIIFSFPALNAAYVTNLTFACILNFVTVMCFLGLHETAREMENPMQNAPNDLPLTTFQAQFNESLITIYAGYHPDSWWEVAKPKQQKQNEESNGNGQSFRTYTSLPNLEEASEPAESDSESSRHDLHCKATTLLTSSPEEDSDEKKKEFDDAYWND